MRIRLVIAAVCAVLVIGVAIRWAAAQAFAVEKVPPRVLAGDDVGFRVEALRGATPVGRIVLRINGQWVPAELASGPLPLSTQ